MAQMTASDAAGKSRVESWVRSLDVFWRDYTRIGCSGSSLARVAPTLSPAERDVLKGYFARVAASDARQAAGAGRTAQRVAGDRGRCDKFDQFDGLRPSAPSLVPKRVGNT